MADKLEQTKQLAFWLNQIEKYERKFKKWEDKSKKIVDRYVDERGEAAQRKAQFNILWSNVQTLLPALYSKQPVPNISRRYDDDKQLGLTVSRVLERAASYYVDTTYFNDIMRQTVLDRLLAGRGTTWVRYSPVFGDAVQETDDELMPELYSEDVDLDFVHWEDFGHTVAKTWQEVRAVWRKVHLDRSELVKRFGEEIGNKIPISTSKDAAEGEMSNSVCVYEIWDKRNKRAIWVNQYRDWETDRKSVV